MYLQRTLLVAFVFTLGAAEWITCVGTLMNMNFQKGFGNDFFTIQAFDWLICISSCFSICWAIKATLGAGERVITGVDSSELPQNIFLTNLLNALWAAEWFHTSVDYFMLLHIIFLIELLVTLWSAEWFFMSLQMICSTELLVTLWAAEWFLTSMGSFMIL